LVVAIIVFHLLVATDILAAAPECLNQERVVNMSLQYFSPCQWVLFVMVDLGWLMGRTVAAQG